MGNLKSKTVRTQTAPPTPPSPRTGPAARRQKRSEVGGQAAEGDNSEMKILVDKSVQIHPEMMEKNTSMKSFCIPAVAFETCSTNMPMHRDYSLSEILTSVDDHNFLDFAKSTGSFEEELLADILVDATSFTSDELDPCVDVVQCLNQLLVDLEERSLEKMLFGTSTVSAMNKRPLQPTPVAACAKRRRIETNDDYGSKMDSPDMDFRFMALNDLIVGIQSQSLTRNILSPKLVQKTLQLLEDVNGEVQTLAVNAVSALFPVVLESERSMIVEAVVAGLFHSDNERFRSVSILALRAMVNATPPDNIKLICILATRSIPTLIESVRSGNSIQVECCEILGDMVSRFGENLLPFHPNIVKCMFQALNSSQPSLRKRAVQMVTNFLSFEDTYATLLAFVKDRFENVLNRAGLGTNPDQQQVSKGEEELTISYFKIALQCLVALARNAECLASQASDLLCNGLILHLLDGNINDTIMPHLKREFGDFYPADAANEFRELGLQCLDNLLRARQRTATQSSHLSRLLDTNFQKIAYVLASMVSYDPNCVSTHAVGVFSGRFTSQGLANHFAAFSHCSYLLKFIKGVDSSEPQDSSPSTVVLGSSGDDDDSKDADDDDAHPESMDYEDMDGDDGDDEEEDDEDDDTSWKVRRTAAKVMDTCVQAYQEKLGHFYAYFAPVLITRLSEDRNESARLELFSCLNSMVRATTLKNPNSLTIRLGQQSAQSMLLRLLPGIFQNIQPFISASSPKRSRSQMSSYCVKTTPASHQAVVNLIRALATALPGHLTAHLPTIVLMVKGDLR
ncbi:unnamed protein product [Hydatigera taeniaeformis]|uniref:Armadillo repeat-containing protein 6 n=1 Tax=Hydatigena taeniaeformis TaxID=6205 RepID=A0A158RDI5_HYDTA|nr:unnamed protein product [Hydatigera taeniaeformis]